MEITTRLPGAPQEAIAHLAHRDAAVQRRDWLAIEGEPAADPRGRSASATRSWSMAMTIAERGRLGDGTHTQCRRSVRSCGMRDGPPKPPGIGCSALGVHHRAWRDNGMARELAATQSLVILLRVPWAVRGRGRSGGCSR